MVSQNEVNVMAISSTAISAQNTFSKKFVLYGDGAVWARRCLICATRDDSTVTLRRYASDGTTVIASLDLGSVMEAVEVPVTGWYDVGVATGNYGGTALTITVEQ